MKYVIGVAPGTPSAASSSPGRVRHSFFAQNSCASQTCSLQEIAQICGFVDQRVFSKIESNSAGALAAFPSLLGPAKFF
jgi:hypothetical protein